MKLPSLFAGALALTFCSWASAHTVLEYQVATAGQSYKATFKVGHGCGPSPTRQIVVDIPAGVQGAKPMPKPTAKASIKRKSRYGIHLAPSF